MKRMLLLILTGLLIANVASAVVDPRPNMMSIYFDTNADTIERIVPAFAPAPVYIMLTNPEFSVIHGYEFGYSIEGNHLFAGIELAGAAPLDVGGFDGNHIVGTGAPLAMMQANVLATLTIIPLDDAPVIFTLKGANPNSLGGVFPNVLLADSLVIPMMLSVGLDYDGSYLPCAFLNEMHPFATVEASWDEVKSLYR